jgi:hypothetical protein
MTARKPKRTTVDAIVYRYMAEDYDDGEEMAKEVTIDRVRSRLAAVIDHVAGLLAALDNPTASTSAATLQGATEIEGIHEFEGLMYDVRDIGAALEPRTAAGAMTSARGWRRARRSATSSWRAPSVIPSAGCGGTTKSCSPTSSPRITTTRRYAL